MFTTRTTTAAASALLLLSLAACTPVGSGGAEGGGDGGGGEAEASGDCITNKTWVLDLADAAAQVGEHLGSSGGLNVTQSLGEGRQDFRFDDDGTATSHVDSSFTISVVDGELELTMVQTHAGDPSGQWEWADDSGNISFSSWDNAGYSVQSQSIVNGTASEVTTSVPEDGLAEGSVMATECSGDTLTTSVTGSPYIHHWTAEG